MKEEGADFQGVTHYTKVEVQPGGINIQNVEHLYQADILKQLGIELQVKQQGETAASAKREGKPTILVNPSVSADEEWQIHDELVFDALPEEVPTLKALVKDVMENVIKLSVPLTVECSAGANWLEAH